MQPTARRGNKGTEEEKDEESKLSLHAILTSVLIMFCYEISDEKFANAGELLI
jgi:hypothetical protein